MGDWLTVIIVLLIVGILLDGWRRMRNAQKDSLRVSRSMRKSAGSGSSPADSYNSAELPNGGARVVGYRDRQAESGARREPEMVEDEYADSDDTEELEPDDDQYEEDLDDLEPTGSEPEEETPAEPEPVSRPKGSIPQQVALNLDESVPILMETTESDDQDSSGRIEPTLGGKENSAKPKKTASSEAKPRTSAAPAAKDKPRDKPKDRPRPEKTPPPEPSDVGEQEREPAPAPPDPEEVLIVNIMAPAGQQFRGDALLEALLQAGLRFGDMNIFHRYQERHGGGPILFSLANMVKPGVFDLDTMDEFSTPGVSLFMTLPLDGARMENVEVFELMLETARSIADELGGEMKDENRSVMTRQTMEHCRQRIHEFERKQLSRSPG